MLVDGPHERHRQHEQRRGRRHAEQQPHPESPVERGREPRPVRIRVESGQVGQQHGAKGDRDQPDGQLHQAVRVVEPGDASGGEQGSQYSADERVHLVDRRRERRRQEQAAHLAHTGVFPVDPRRPQELQPRQERQLEHQLHPPGHQHAPGQGHDRSFEQGRDDEGRRDQYDVQQDRREGRDRVAMKAVEERSRICGERDERQVREGDAQHGRRQRQALVVARETGREHQRESRRAEHAGDAHQDQDDGEVARHRAHEAVEQPPVPGPVLRQHRHEGLCERSLGKQAPEEVRHPERDEERVRHAARAEKVRQDDIARETGHPRQHGHRRDHGPLRVQVGRVPGPGVG